MRAHRLQRWLVVGALLALPVTAYAQEATLSGTVSDTTGGALPGVTVRALHDASGNSFEAVTDARGDYRLPLRVGAYRVTAELAGFASVTRTLTLLVGQQAVVNLQMGVSAVQESVTVTGEAPLLDVTQSSLGGNIDPRQLRELPVQGRNWVSLIMLAPGARVNAVSEVPTSRPAGDFQLNIDGQQITQLTSGSTTEGQPRFSQDAIAEFEFLSSRFDATQGRSAGVQVNAVTKSGTNTPSGSFSGYFRDDRFIAADPVAKKVLPYQDQQLSGTFGGPIRKDKLHFFANYEYEREPQTFFYTTPYPHLNRELTYRRTEKKGGGRLDAQFSPQTRLAVRGNAFRWGRPFHPQGTTNFANSTPSAVYGRLRMTNQVLGTLTQVLSNRVVNEVKVGYAYFRTDSTFTFTKNPRGHFFGSGGPVVLLSGLTAGAPDQYPQDQNQSVYSVRDDFTYSSGRHTVKLGAEYLHQQNVDFRCFLCDGQLDARKGPIPVDVAVLFPDQFDVSTWNLAPLSSVTTRWSQGVGVNFRAVIPRYGLATWVQDDWKVLPRLTLNLGLRYDLELNAFANDVVMLPFFPGNKPEDTNNVGPRLGFSFSLNDRTVMRGGYGLYFGTINVNKSLVHASRTLSLGIPNDGRPDFASNPWNGPEPTYEQVKARLCTAAAPLAPGCITREINSGTVYGPDFVMPYSHQASIGLQRQLGNTMAIEADYVYLGSRGQETQSAQRSTKQSNLSYDPVTGVNYPFKDISKRPFPEWGAVNFFINGYRANQHALQTAFTKRFSQGWQASGTYTLSGVWDANPQPYSGLAPVPFKVEPGIGGEYTLGVGDQRHRAVFNGIWQLRYGFQLSGLYFFGSGERYDTRWGADLQDTGDSGGPQRLRPNGTLVPRNNFVGKPIHRVDLRAQRRFPLGGRAGIDGILEVFNLFNHANFGNYVTQEVAKNYGAAASTTGGIEYAPRTLELGFRLMF